jgi:hypothetical protein
VTAGGRTISVRPVVRPEPDFKKVTFALLRYVEEHPELLKGDPTDAGSDSA